jgi:hypothetical protein
MNKRGGKANAKGRSQNSRFVRLDHYLLESAAYRSLSPNARSLLVELSMIDNGSNNGAIWLSVKDASARIGNANLQSVSAAFRELETAGFIRLTRDAHFRVKASGTARARCWRLTWLAVPAASMAPTNEWKTYDPPPQTRERKRMLAGQQALKRFKKVQSEGKSPVYDLHTLEASKPDSEPEPVYDLHTGLRGNVENPPNLNIYNSHTYTAAKGVRGQERPLIARDPVLEIAVAALCRPEPLPLAA